MHCGINDTLCMGRTTVPGTLESAVPEGGVTAIGPSAQWQPRKPALQSPHGIVASQHWMASRAGARVLARGGNAADAAIVTAFSLGVLEPWLSGIGGCGFLLYYSAREKTVRGVDFGTVAPQNLDAGAFPLTAQESEDWFNWPQVVDDRNLEGYSSICVPTQIAGLAMALETFGTLSWADALAPAIEFANRGLPVDWYASLCIAVDSRGLDKFPASRSIFLPEGRAPVAADAVNVKHLPFPGLANTLTRLAGAGPRDFYEGEIAGRIVSDLQAGGNATTAQDLAAYEARIVEPLRIGYRGADLHAMPGLSGGPTFVDIMARFSDHLAPADGLGAENVVSQVDAIRSAFDKRLTGEGHGASCTSHLSVIDAEGNMAALTGTLLSRFGSKVVLPETGMLMNNGMMWFDPRPGRPNSIKAGARPLANMCPVIATRDGEPLMAIGAAGGRQIIPTVTQLLSYVLDFGMSLEDAFHYPRVNAEGRILRCNKAMNTGHLSALAERFELVRVDDTVYPVQFANPSAVMRDTGSGGNIGMVHVNSPWPAAAAADTSDFQ